MPRTAPYVHSLPPNHSSSNRAPSICLYTRPATNLFQRRSGSIPLPSRPTDRKGATSRAVFPPSYSTNSALQPADTHGIPRPAEELPIPFSFHPVRGLSVWPPATALQRGPSTTEPLPCVVCALLFSSFFRLLFIPAVSSAMHSEAKLPWGSRGPSSLLRPPYA